MKANEMNLKDSYPVYEISANPYGGNTATLHGVMTSEDNAFLLIGALQGLGENPGNYAYVSPWLKKPMIVRPDGDTAWASSFECAVLLECTLENATQANSIALALSQQ